MFVEGENTDPSEVESINRFIDGLEVGEGLAVSSRRLSTHSLWRNRSFRRY